jgi:hypothetical protein
MIGESIQHLILGIDLAALIGERYAYHAYGYEHRDQYHKYVFLHFAFSPSINFPSSFIFDYTGNHSIYPLHQHGVHTNTFASLVAASRPTQGHPYGEKKQPSRAPRLRAVCLNVPKETINRMDICHTAVPRPSRSASLSTR